MTEAISIYCALYNTTVTLHSLWGLTLTAVAEMRDELLRRAGECRDESMTSQPTACLMLALRSLSMLTSMRKLLEVDSFDGYDVLQRAYMEARDLLTTFRFDDEDTRKRVMEWFRDVKKDSWKPDHVRCERFLHGAKAVNLQLARKWGIFSELSHPKYRAVHNSVAVLRAYRSSQEQLEAVGILQEKIADYITAVVSLFIAASFDLPGWIPLSCDTARMCSAEKLRTTAADVVIPLLNRVDRR